MPRKKIFDSVDDLLLMQDKIKQKKGMQGEELPDNGFKFSDHQKSKGSKKKEKLMDVDQIIDGGFDYKKENYDLDTLIDGNVNHHKSQLEKISACNPTSKYENKRKRLNPQAFSAFDELEYAVNAQSVKTKNYDILLNDLKKLSRSSCPFMIKCFRVTKDAHQREHVNLRTDKGVIQIHSYKQYEVKNNFFKVYEFLRDFIKGECHFDQEQTSILSNFIDIFINKYINMETTV